MSNILGAFVSLCHNLNDMGRQPNADTPHKIIIHTNGGRRYASTKQFTTGDDGRKRYSYKLWGTVDKDLKFQPNTNPLSEK